MSVLLCSLLMIGPSFALNPSLFSLLPFSSSLLSLLLSLLLLTILSFIAGIIVKRTVPWEEKEFKKPLLKILKISEKSIMILLLLLALLIIFLIIFNKALPTTTASQPLLFLFLLLASSLTVAIMVFVFIKGFLLRVKRRKK